jgi:predicted RNA-binding protein with PIN domain
VISSRDEAGDVKRVIVDGYNVIHAWPELVASLGRHGLEAARSGLIDRMAEFRASTAVDVVIVFDSHGRRKGSGDRETVEGVEVRYGSRLESADHVIERLIYDAVRRNLAADTVVATNDRLQRAMVAAMGVATMSAQALLDDVRRASQDRGTQIRRRQDDAHFSGRIEHRLDPEVRRRLEQMRRGGSTPTDGDPEADPPPSTGSD